ncbi:MAG: ATP-binding protein, partial [Ignavibacteriales bacterium]|nr:ATP-binding protein [Ignavibacteriales bacterium]
MLLNGYSVWLFAPRRYGKSSLIKHVYKKISPEIKTIYFDFYNIKSVDDFVRKYSNVLAKELFNWKDDVKKLSKQLGKYLKSLQPQLSFDTTASPSILLSSNNISEQNSIEEVLNLPERIAKEQKKKVCIAFDEFQEISRIDKFLINWMRSSFQNQKNVSYVFLGSKQSLMQDIFTDINSPFYEYALKMDIGTIEKTDLYSFILNKFKQEKLGIQSKTINDILEYS